MGPSREPGGRWQSSRSPGIDQALALAGDVVDVLRDLGALHLAVSETAPQLADELGLVIPALHVALGEHTAARVARKIAADLDAASLHERSGLALFAEAEALERREQVNAEAVIGGEHVDVLGGHAGHRNRPAPPRCDGRRDRRTSSAAAAAWRRRSPRTTRSRSP